MKHERKKAVALKYNEIKHSAPIVKATGKGIIADQIMETAKKNNVPLIEDKTLVELLSELNINDTIPVDLYEVIAEVFAFIYHIDQQK